MLKHYIFLVLFISCLKLQAVELPTVQINKIKSTLTSHFANNASTNNWTLAQYKDLNLYLELKKLDQQLALMIDKGQDLTEFEQYGIIKRNEGDYSIDMNNHPRWLTIDRLFMHLHQSNLSKIKSYRNRLIQMGFRPSDFDKLITYIQKTNIKQQVNTAKSKLNQQYAQKVHRNYQQKVDNSKLIVKWGMALEKQTQRIYRDWSVNLLNQFNKQQQRILIEQAHQHTIKIILTPSTPTDAHIQKLEQLIANKNSHLLDN